MWRVWPEWSRRCRKLQAGESPQVSTEGRPSHNYTHPGWTDYLKYRKVVQQLRRERA